MAEFRMPSLGADMEFGTLVAWHVKRGDRIRRGDVIADVETQKGVIAVEAFHGGLVEELLVMEGTRVPVGAVMARLSDGAEPPAVSTVPAPPAAAAPLVVPLAAVPPTAGPGRVTRASPAARRLAAERGIDLDSIAGTGPDGAITLPDVERAAAPAAPARRARRISPVAQRMIEGTGLEVAQIVGTGPDGSITRVDVERALAARPVPPRPAAVPPPVLAPSAGAAMAERPVAMREAIAAAVTRSKREIPHFYLAIDVDLARTMAWLGAENAKRSVRDRLLPAGALIRAVARALVDVPEFNGFWIDGAFRPGSGIHVGVAISLRGGGLVAPAIHDADRKSVEVLTGELRDLVQRARGGGLRSSEIMDPTITVTNLGDQGADSVLGVIYPPQVALVGFGRVRERPWAEAGMLAVRPIVTVTLSADHRSSDGHRGGLFLAALAKHAQVPEDQ